MWQAAWGLLRFRSPRSGRRCAMRRDLIRHLLMSHSAGRVAASLLVLPGALLALPALLAGCDQSAHRQRRACQPPRRAAGTVSAMILRSYQIERLFR